MLQLDRAAASLMQEMANPPSGQMIHPISPFVPRAQPRAQLSKGSSYLQAVRLGGEKRKSRQETKSHMTIKGQPNGSDVQLSHEDQLGQDCNFIESHLFK